ncbi:MAG: ketol-acid reductoisomerase [Phycisphaerales bacterium]
MPDILVPVTPDPREVAGTPSAREQAAAAAEPLLRDGWRLIAGPTPGPTEEDLAPLAGKCLVLLGYGNQGRAHALNLRDSGLAPIVCLRAGSPRATLARDDGLVVHESDEVLREADFILLAAPDHAHASIARDAIDPLAKPGATVGFLHGHSLFAGEVAPREDLGVVMVAPKGPGTTVRARYLEGRGIPALIAVAQDPAGDARARAIAWAKAIGCGRSGLVETTFAAEAVSDLFGEQSVLCGGLLASISVAFEVMVEAGSPPELAYLECIHELKQVADLLYARGPSGMRAAISETAEYGALELWRDRDRLIDRAYLERRLREIAAGAFSQRMAADRAAGDAWLAAARRDADADPMESAGAAVRALMPWLIEQDAASRSTELRSDRPSSESSR